MIISALFDDLGADGAPRRLGIMGGTFDPIHLGHLACAEQARETFGLDAVIFIPTGMPVFKLDRAITAAQDRLAMVQLAIRSNPFFDVSSLEIDREGCTYTIDTIRALRDHYPDNVELFFITGADALSTILRWRDCDDIGRLSRLIAISRPGFSFDDSLKAELDARGVYRVDYLETARFSISSSEVRERVAQGKSIRYLVISEVRNYILEHGLYKPAQDEELQGTSQAGFQDDPLGKAFYKARHKDLKDRVGKKRLKHIEGVAQTARDLALIYGVDPAKASLAGLLHDWDKGYSGEQMQERVQELGLDELIDPRLVRSMPQVFHGQTAAAALAREYPSIPIDVLQAIARHTTGAIPMSDLDMVIYIADALEPGRTYGTIDDLRAMVGKVDLEELFYQTYRYWVILLLEQAKTMHPDTIEVYNFYAARHGARKAAERD